MLSFTALIKFFHQAKRCYEVISITPAEERNKKLRREIREKGNTETRLDMGVEMRDSGRRGGAESKEDWYI